MFGIGETEFVIILVFGFLLFGPDRLPGMGRTIGRALRQFRHAQEGFTEVVQSEVMDPLQKAMNDPEDGAKTSKARTAAYDEDADLEGSAPAKRQAESFAERKRRLEAERAAREAKQEEAEKAAPSQDADLADADSDADAQPSAATSAEPKEDKAPDTSAAALYAMKPKKSAQKSTDADGAAEEE